MSKWLLFTGVAIILVGVAVFYKPKSFYVQAISDNGVLELNDGKKIQLADVEISPAGEEKHEAAIFMLKEMTKNVDVWFEQSNEGYRVWVGCKKMIWTVDCSKALFLNEALVKAGVAKENK